MFSASLLVPASLKCVFCSLLQSVYLWFLSLIQMVGRQQSLVTDPSLNSQSKICYIFSLDPLKAPYFSGFLVFPEVLSRAEDQTAVEQPEKTLLAKKSRTKVLVAAFICCVFEKCIFLVYEKL